MSVSELGSGWRVHYIVYVCGGTVCNYYEGNIYIIRGVLGFCIVIPPAD